MACLASVLEVRGTQLANLDNCEHSLRIINSIVNRSGIMAQQLDTQVLHCVFCVSCWFGPVSLFLLFCLCKYCGCAPCVSPPALFLIIDTLESLFSRPLPSRVMATAP